MAWVLAFHIISMVAWFAGLFYLPRLFVYHSVATDALSMERFKVMERRLYWGIMTPAAVMTVFLGSWVLIVNWAYYQSQIWMHIKLALVACLLIYQFCCRIWLKAFARDENHYSQKFYRIINEVPTLFLIAIVILVVVKP